MFVSLNLIDPHVGQGYCQGQDYEGSRKKALTVSKKYLNRERNKLHAKYKEEIKQIRAKHKRAR